MRRIQCKGCGSIIEAVGEQVYCPDCRRKAKQAAVIRDRVCRSCGISFPGGSRAWYCPTCRAERAKDARRRYRRNGAARTLGSTDLCARCGAEYTVESGRQKYCPACAEIAVAEVTRPAKRAYNRAHRDELAARKDRNRTDRKICVICGKPINSGTTTVTCSPECAMLHRRQKQREADQKRRPRKRGNHEND